MNIAIQSGKPIPPPGKPGRRRVYPLDKMAVGDSFFVPGVTYQSMASSVKWFVNHQEGDKWSFRVRKDTADGQTGVSVFRVE